jgi:hypothetical protein
MEQHGDLLFRNSSRDQASAHRPAQRNHLIGGGSFPQQPPMHPTVAVAGMRIGVMNYRH